ncbi:MAG TPA: methyltransferase domain-containing protein [Gemmataceae bacterium]|nr:methyltransferase domain-containing protein [Gemmataceae bacterium]
MSPSPADWQLPPGVSRGLWHYLHDDSLARRYDGELADCALLDVDRRFAESHFDRPGRLIDLGCGTGRLLLPFARRGWWVLGVDLSAEMLQVAAAKARAADVPVQLLQANLVELDGLADQSFDQAACLFSTLGMVVGAEHRRRVVAQVRRLLRPGGKFILHVHNRYFAFWDPRGRSWLLRNLFAGSEKGDRQMPAHDGLPPLTLHLFTRREAVRLLRREGFRIVEVRPVSLRTDGRLSWPWWFGWLRAYGYLIAAERM